jgi:hypothetical protein
MVYNYCMDKNISRDGAMQMLIIENHLLELYQAGVEEERHRIVSVIRDIIKEKQIRSDHDAIAVLDWALDRILRS